MTAPASAAEGANRLDNGDFEWVLDCDFWVGKYEGGSADPPAILGSGGNPCAYLDMAVDGDDTKVQLVELEVVDVTAAVEKWIVLRFDAMASDDGFGVVRGNP